MMNSISLKNKHNKIPIWSIIFWLIIWQIVSVSINSEILLVSPVKVMLSLSEMIKEVDFWKSVSFTFIRIDLGFLVAVFAAILIGTLSYLFIPVRELFILPVSVIKAVPVASFIILVLIWVPSRNLSVIISFLMTFPIMYTNICEGLFTMDKKLTEMADVFRLPFSKRIRFIYVPQVLPYFKAACSLALGMCWKSGIAAEIIGLPRGSVGERLYEAKIYLNTSEMFAWTIVIIAFSITFEKVVMFFINIVANKLEGR